MASTITCSCGETLRSEDEEALYTFVRAHIEQLHTVAHPSPHSRLRSRSGRAERREDRTRPLATVHS